MLSRNRVRSWVIGLSLGTVVALLISPATRWLVVSQFAASGLTFRSPDAQTHHTDAVSRQIVASLPNDVQIQMAAPQAGGSSESKVAHLRTLVSRFPNNPSLYANLLRYEIGNSADKNGVYLSRREDWAFSSQGPPSGYQESPPPDSRLLAAFDADAATGERLDPENAYFPMMRAIGLFAVRRDTEGIDAVERAGQKTSWREYVADETNARLRLADAANGRTPALGRVAIVASVLFPNYAALRAVARVATVKAIQSEQAGQPGRGLVIRRAVMRCGGLMRTQSSSYIGSLVGIAIAAISTARPGGALPVGTLPGGHTATPAEMAQRRLQAFCAYARRIGHPEVAQEAQAEEAAGQSVRSLWSKAKDKSVFGVAQMSHLEKWWVSDLLTLANTLWLLALSAAAAGLARLSAIRERRPLPHPTLYGVIAALLMVALAAFDIFSGDQTHFWPTALGMALIASTLGVFTVRLLRTSPDGRAALRRDVRQFAQAFLLTGLVLSALSALAGEQAQGVIGFVGAVRAITGQSGSDEGTSGGVPQAQDVKAAVVLGSLSGPLLLLLILSIRARLLRVPASAACVYGFRTGGLLVACVLICVYGVLVLNTLQLELKMAAGLQQMVEHEGRYYASLAGQPWPDTIP